MKFQPMPKRFMVWDRQNKVFLTQPMEIWQIVNHFQGRVGDLVNDDLSDRRYVFYQSTNLFDKDGKEIFEGGIIDYNDDGSALGVVVGGDGEWRLKDRNGNLLFLKGAPHQKLVGHILSNPELLEEQ